MTRRKQNTPKRLKSEEEGSERGPEEGEVSSCDSEDDASEASSMNELQSDEEMSKDDDVCEEKVVEGEAERGTEHKGTDSEEREGPDVPDVDDEGVKDGVGEIKSEGEGEEVSSKDNIDVGGISSSESKESQTVLKVENNSIETKDNNTDTKPALDEGYAKANEKPLLGPSVKKPKLSREDICDSVPLPKCVKDKTKSNRRPSGPVTPPKLCEKPSGMDSESPISKLLSMVNNPEKIQRKHSSYSHSFSLPACSLKSSSSTSPKHSASRGFPSTAPSTSTISHSRSSKPLSGFLPPYNMFPSQVHNMYGKYSSSKTGQPKDEGREDTKPPLTQVKAKQSPKKDHKSSPVPSPSTTADQQEQPLDLSVKSKGLDLSIKTSSGDLGHELCQPESSERTSSIREKHIPRKGPADSCRSPSLESSSLRSLEEKFGGNAFRTDKPSSQRGPKSYLPYMHPMLSMYGGALYTPALFSTHPWMHTEKLPRSEIPQRKTNSNPGGSTSTSPSKSTSQRSNSTEREYSSPQQKHSSPPDIITDKLDTDSYYNNKKHTNLRCSCKKEFETLYELTVHLKQSGHTPCSRVTGQQEFPKLVRGQDMWLNHGSEQTKQILRCIRCGESFKTLPELTIHMMKTKHYANIVGGGSDSVRKMHRYPTDDLDIYKCYQCEESFHGTEEISKHMLSSGHHKSPIVIQPVSPNLSSPSSIDRVSKSLSRECSPARQRSVSESSNTVRISSTTAKSNDVKDYDRDDSSVDSYSCEDSKIRCETCGDKIEMSKFVAHVRKCIRTGIWDYGTPLKKRRLDNIDNNSNRTSHSNDHFDLKRKYSETTGSSEKLVNGRSSPSSPRLKEKASKDTPLPPHSDSSNDGSALRAMESFIEKSFTPGANRDKANLFGFGNIGGSRGFAMPHLNGHSESLKPGGGCEASNPVSANLYSKYLPPLYLTTLEKKQESNIERLKSESDYNLKESKERATPPKSQQGSPTESRVVVDSVMMDEREERKPSPKKSPVITTENNNKPEGHSKCCTDTPPGVVECQQQQMSVEKASSEDVVDDDGRKSLTPSPDALQEKYLNIPEEEAVTAVSTVQHIKATTITTKVACNTTSSSISSSSSTSVLESLQGLVYGKKFDTTEHPLDSLQKLIHTTDKASTPEKQPPNGSVEISVKNSPTIKSLFSSNSLIPSPFLAAFPTCHQSSPNSPCKSECSASPAPESHHSSDRRSPESSENEFRPPSEGELDKSDSQQGGEFSCEACSRSFASVGAYRYHASRCHLSKAKNYQYKENLKKTPYVYLPLDHSAKFNKYYEMANELASKTK